MAAPRKKATATKSSAGKRTRRAKAAAPAAAKRKTRRAVAKPARAATRKTTARAKAAAPKRAARKTTAAKTAAASRKTAPRKTVAARAAAKPAKRGRPRKVKPDTSAGNMVTLASRLLVRSLSARLGPKGIGYGQYPVLMNLWKEDGLTQKELSNRVRIEAPTMVRTLDRMERDKLVVRKRSDADRRQIHIQLTAKGRALERELASLSGEVDKVALSGLGKTGREQLQKLMGKVIKNLEGDTATSG